MPEWMFHTRLGHTARVYDGLVMADDHPETHSASEGIRDASRVQILSLRFQIVSCCRCTHCDARNQSQNPIVVDAPPDDNWWGVEQAATYLKLTPKTVREGAARGILPGCKYPPRSIRGKWRFKKEDLDKHLKSRQAPARRQAIERSIWE